MPQRHMQKAERPDWGGQIMHGSETGWGLIYSSNHFSTILHKFWKKTFSQPIIKRWATLIASERVSSPEPANETSWEEKRWKKKRKRKQEKKDLMKFSTIIPLREATRWTQSSLIGCIECRDPFYRPYLDIHTYIHIDRLRLGRSLGTHR